MLNENNSCFFSCFEMCTWIFFVCVCFRHISVSWNSRGSIAAADCFDISCWLFVVMMYLHKKQTAQQANSHVYARSRKTDIQLNVNIWKCNRKRTWKIVTNGNISASKRIFFGENSVSFPPKQNINGHFVFSTHFSRSTKMIMGKNS